MLFAPKSDNSLDSLFWREIPQEFQGKVTSLDKLKEMFPEVQILKEEERQIIYGVQKEKSSPQYVAYECLNCNELIFGPPKKKEINNLNPETFSGKIGTEVYCHNCNSYIKENISLMS